VHRFPVLATLAALAAPLTAPACRAPAAPGDTGVVVRVTDGDTIVVAIGGREENVRLLGIDTPEVHTDDGAPECFGPDASAFTASLLPAGTTVRLERDVVGRDDYGRLLAYVYAGDVLVNEVIVARGYATPLSIEPNTTFARRFADAARAAEAADLGLWSACAG
jgi:micrococcal nuclease